MQFKTALQRIAMLLIYNIYSFSLELNLWIIVNCLKQLQRSIDIEIKPRGPLQLSCFWQFRVGLILYKGTT